MKTEVDNSDRSIVIVCSNTMFDENPLGAKPFSQALETKYNVIYVDPPFSIATAIKQTSLRSKIFASKFNLVSPNLMRVTPLVFPGKDRPFIHKLTSLLLKKSIKKAVRKSGYRSDDKPFLIATAPHYRIFSKDFFNIYWMMDDYACQPELTGIDSKVLEEGQLYQCVNANKIVAVSKDLATSLDKEFVSKTSVIVNGADDKLFRFPCASSHLTIEQKGKLPKTNFAIYAGGLNERIDFNYLEVLAQAGVELVLVGSKNAATNDAEFTKLVSQPNVHYVGSIDYEEIPAWLNLASVGIVPYKENAFNKVSMPLKIPEYLLCGLPVISTKLPFTQSFERDDVQVASDEKDFLNKVQSALLNPPFPSQRAMRSARIAQDWSWKSKTESFLKKLT